MADEIPSADQRKPGEFIQVSPLYPNDDVLRVFGEVSFLAFYAKMYQGWSVQMMARAFEPPVYLKQFTVYRADGVPRGLVTWAKLNKAAEEKHISGAGLDSFDEWNSGDQLWIMDIMSPWGHGKQIIKNIVETVQEDSVKTVRIHRGQKKIVEWHRPTRQDSFRLRRTRVDGKE